MSQYAKSLTAVPFAWYGLVESIEEEAESITSVIAWIETAAWFEGREEERIAEIDAMLNVALLGLARPVREVEPLPLAVGDAVAILWDGDHYGSGTVTMWDGAEFTITPFSSRRGRIFCTPEEARWLLAHEDLRRLGPDPRD